jgi:hypothetical protein
MITDLRAPLRQVAETGIAVVPGAVAVPAGLVDEFATLRYKEPPRDAHPVTTRSELAVLSTWDGYPLLARLRASLVAAVNRSVADWQPDQIFVRRYRDGSEGMSPHRDGTRFRLLVATVSVLGSASFFRHNSNGAVTHAWPVGPGDLVLLRGMGLRGVEDGRPYHSVGGPAGDYRCSVAFRMTSRP